MAYCGIMRVEKRKSGAIGGICAENTRTEQDRDKKHFDKSDVDWDRTSCNLDMTITKDEDGELQVSFSPHRSHGHWAKDYSQQMKDAKAQGMRIRKDSNAMIDGFYSASHDFWKDKLDISEDGKKVELTEAGKEYFADCLKEHVLLYCQGDPTRVHGAVVHLDEATPHLHCNSDCLYEDEKGLHWSADKICGNKLAYQSRQDRFFEDVTKDWGLDRADDKNLDKEGNIVRSEDVRAHLSVQEYKEHQTAQKTRQMIKIQKNLQQEIEHAKERAKEASRSVSKLEVSKSTLKAEKARLTAEIDAQNESIKEKQKELDTKDSDIKAKKEEIKNLGKQQEDIIADFTAKVESKQKEKDKLLKSVRHLKAKQGILNTEQVLNIETKDTLSGTYIKVRKDEFDKIKHTASLVTGMTEDYNQKLDRLANKRKLQDAREVAFASICRVKTSSVREYLMDKLKEEMQKEKPEVKEILFIRTEAEDASRDISPLGYRLMGQKDKRLYKALDEPEATLNLLREKYPDELSRLIEKATQDTDGNRQRERVKTVNRSADEYSH